MTGELKKPSELEGFIDKLTLALKNELEQDLVGTKEEKVLRAVEKLYQLYAQELDKYQGKGLLHVAGKRNATDLVEVLLLMGFDNTSLAALLSRSQGKNWVPRLIEDKGVSYLEGVSCNPSRGQVILYGDLDVHLLQQYKPYQEYLVSIFNFMVHEEFNKQLPSSREKNLAVIICDYIGFGADPDELYAIDKKIGLRNRLLKPLINYCTTHFLDYEARQILNELLIQKKIFSTNVEDALDRLLEKPVHWNKPYTYSLLLSRINTQKETQHVMADEIKGRVTRVMQDTFKTTIKAQYIKECKSYSALLQKYSTCRVDSLKLLKGLDIQKDYFAPGVVFSLLVLLMQIASISVLPFLGVNIAFTGLYCALGVFISFLVLALNGFTHPISPRLRYVPSLSFPNENIDVKNSAPEENIELQLEQLKAHYESIQTASAQLKRQWVVLQHYEPSVQEEFKSIQANYRQYLKFLVGYAAVSTVALVLGIIGICLSNPLMFIGLTASGAVSSVLATIGLFKRSQCSDSVSKPARIIEASVEPGL